MVVARTRNDPAVRTKGYSSYRLCMANDRQLTGEKYIAALIVVGEVWDEQARRRLAESVAPPAP